MIYVVSKFYDKKRPQASLMTESEVKELGWYDGFNESFASCDLYVDGFEDADEATAFARQARNA